MEFKENNYDNDGIVLIPADSEGPEIPTDKQVEEFVAAEQGGQWEARGGWHSTGDTEEVYIQVTRIA